MGALCGDRIALRVAALTSGRNTPSTRFRVRQHIGSLGAKGINVREFCPKLETFAPLPLWPEKWSPIYVLPYYAAWQLGKVAARAPSVLRSRRYDAVWLERELLPGYPTLEGMLRGPIVLDVDDAIWLARPWGRRSVAAMARRAAVVLAGNKFIADWFTSNGSPDVRVVPTSIDVDRFKPRSGNEATGHQSFVVGWTGTHANFRYLDTISRPLAAFLKAHKDARLLIIADQAPRLDLAHDQVEFVRWSPASEAEILQRLDVGLMPLSDDEWTRGKCAFKMIQYMATGLPIVVSPVGMNLEILRIGDIGLSATSEQQWFDALELLYRERALGTRWGRTARLIATSHFSTDVVGATIARAFQDLER
jgi:glycosyltransferase involved in cell wall biosynthesis